MAKRFTDTEKWNRPWFRKLPTAYKIFWEYLCDKCDAAGVWYVDFELAEFICGEHINETEALRLFEKQIKVLESGKRWWIEPFVDFQYGDLVPNNNMHRGVLRMLGQHGIKIGPRQGLLSPSQGAMGTDTDTGKDKVKVSVQKPLPQGFEVFWDAYPRKIDKQDAVRAWAKIGHEAGIETKIMDVLERYKASDQWVKDGGEFIPHPATWLNKRRWESDPPPAAASTNGQRRNPAYERFCDWNSSDEVCTKHCASGSKFCPDHARKAAEASGPRGGGFKTLAGQPPGGSAGDPGRRA